MSKWCCNSLCRLCNDVGRCVGLSLKGLYSLCSFGTMVSEIMWVVVLPNVIVLLFLCFVWMLLLFVKRQFSSVSVYGIVC